MTDPREGCSRRDFVSALTLAGTAGLLGVRPEEAAAEPPPETTRLRLVRTRALCFAPLHLAEELLQGEGFAEVRHVAADGRTADALASDRADISMDFIGPLLIRVDAGDPILILAGDTWAATRCSGPTGSGRSPTSGEGVSRCRRWDLGSTSFSPAC